MTMKRGKISGGQSGFAVAEGKTRWGWVRVRASERGVVAVEWPTPEPHPLPPPGARTPLAGEGAAEERARQAVAEIAEYLAGQRQEFAVPVDWGAVGGFTRQVLEACAGVPFGRTVSYGELARAVGSPRAARAVGQALGRNPAPMIVPCHRVLAAGGKLGGFGGGLDMKRRLLELEGAKSRPGAN